MRRLPREFSRSPERSAGADGPALRPLDRLLERAERRRDLALLADLLRRSDPRQRRAALRAALRVADELEPGFPALLSALVPDERALLLGVRLEASRLDPNRERRLARLRRLIRALPAEQRALYWPEAQALALRGGDDAHLALLGIARDLPAALAPLTLEPLRRGARRVRDPYKRAAAYRALAELIPLDDDEATDARHSAARVPDATLRGIAAPRFGPDPRLGDDLDDELDNDERGGEA